MDTDYVYIIAIGGINPTRSTKRSFVTKLRLVLLV